MMVDPNDGLEESAYDAGLRGPGNASTLTDDDLDAVVFASAHFIDAESPAQGGYLLRRTVLLAVAELRTARALIAGFDDAASRWGDALGKEQTKNAALEKRLADVEMAREHAIAESRVPRSFGS